jgi:hypothetical protein
MPDPNDTPRLSEDEEQLLAELEEDFDQDEATDQHEAAQVARAEAARLLNVADELDAGTLSSERTHELEARGHDSRVDELSEERATHPDEDGFDEPWIRPSSLEAPDPREGMVQRWVRVSTRGVDDPRNVSMRQREGWVPRNVDSIPAEYLALSGGLGVTADGSMGRFIVDDLLLCEMPEKKFAQRKKYYDTLTQRQMDAVEHDLESAQIPGHRIVKTHTSQVSHPSRVVGRRVEAAADD